MLQKHSQHKNHSLKNYIFTQDVTKKIEKIKKMLLKEPLKNLSKNCFAR